MMKRGWPRKLCAIACLALVLSGAGCRTSSDGGDANVGPPPGVSSPPDLSTPQEAVRSYLDYVSLAYRMVNSSVTTEVATADESVRLDAYIELHKQENRAIEQRVRTFSVRSEAVAEPTATVAAHEVWDYRYFDITSLEYVSEPLEATYETTYTVILQPDGRWLVDSVEAAPAGPVE